MGRRNGLAVQKISSPPGFKYWNIQLLVSRYTDTAIQTELYRHSYTDTAIPRYVVLR